VSYLVTVQVNCELPCYCTRKLWATLLLYKWTMNQYVTVQVCLEYKTSIKWNIITIKKIHREVGRAKDLSAPRYLCNLVWYWLQAPWGWHDSVETCRSVTICEIIVHLLVRIQNKNQIKNYKTIFSSLELFLLGSLSFRSFRAAKYGWYFSTILTPKSSAHKF